MYYLGLAQWAIELKTCGPSGGESAVHCDRLLYGADCLWEEEIEGGGGGGFLFCTLFSDVELSYNQEKILIQFKSEYII